MKFFVTGTAGFVGFHLASRLLADGHQVVGYDGITDYYDPALKRARLAILAKLTAFTSIEAMLEDKHRLTDAIANFKPEIVVHLAAQAGVRYSLENPATYVSANLVGTFNLLEVVKDHRPNHLLIASTSSIYGGNQKRPFVEIDRTDFPVSFYAATKKSVEAMAHSYSHLFAIPTTMLRFFTVYGPWGRPDMALFKFVAAMRAGEPITAYGQGLMLRDFTYIDDLIEAIVRLGSAIPGLGAPLSTTGVVDSLSPVAPWRAVNIGTGKPVTLAAFIEVIEAVMGRRAAKTMLPMQPGDVVETFADPGLLKALTGFVPATSMRLGVENFVRWYLEFRATTTAPSL